MGPHTTDRTRVTVALLVGTWRLAVVATPWVMETAAGVGPKNPNAAGARLLTSGVTGLAEKWTQLGAQSPKRRESAVLTLKDPGTLSPAVSPNVAPDGFIR